MRNRSGDPCRNWAQANLDHMIGLVFNQQTSHIRLASFNAPQIQTDMLDNPGNMNKFGQQNIVNPNAFGRLSPNAPNLMLDKSASSQYQFVSKKARKQHWLTHFKTNKKLNTELQLKGYSPNKDSKAFLISIKGTFGIPMSTVLYEKQPLEGAKFYMEYYMTLFNKDIGTHGSFYGRTFRSSPILLKDSGNAWDTTQEEYVYFHTNYVEKSSYAVVECVVVREYHGSKTYSSSGYALCSIFDFSGLTNVELTRGSPRAIGQIGLAAVANSMKSAGRFQYEIRDFEVIQSVKRLVSQNCFFSPGEVIPGLADDKMTKPKIGNANLGQNLKIELSKTETIYIHNIQMITSIAFESRFESFLRKMKLERSRTAKMGENHNVSDSVIIQERRMVVSANNTWKNICDDSYLSLSRPNEQGVSTFFRIEYKAMLPGLSDNKDVYFTIGWTYHVPTLNQIGMMTDETVEADFELGPGQVPTGDLLWDPSADDMTNYQVRLRAVISTNPQAPQDSGDSRLNLKNQTGYGAGYHQAPAPYPNQRQLNNTNPYQQKNQALSPMEQEAMRQKEYEIQQLQDRIKYQEKLQDEQNKRFERLEMDKFGDKSGNPNQQFDQQNSRYKDEQKLIEIQKHQMQNEMEMMRRQMQEYQQSILDATRSTNQQPHNQQYQGSGNQNPYGSNNQNPYGQNNQYGSNNYGGQPGYGTQGGNGYANQFNQLQQMPMEQSNSQQIAMIGNVFYNMLNLIGETERDKRIIGLSEDLKKMIQQQRFDDLLAPKAPYVGMGMVNLLKTTDLPIHDQVNFIKNGYGELLQHPTAQILSTSIQQNQLSLQNELADPLKASTVTFKFLCYKAPVSPQDYLPSKLFFQFKFFTFPSLQTDKVKIVCDEHQDGSYKLGQVFYLSKEHPGVSRALTTNLMQQQAATNKLMQTDTRHDPNLLAITFEIDPSLSRIKDENVKLSHYLKERFLTVDVFDGDTLFLYGTCKIPLYELMRQGKQTIVRAKECEMCDPDTGDFRGAIQMIMSNQGKYVSIQEEEGMMRSKANGVLGDTINQRSGSPQKSRFQPSQQDGSGKKGKYKKIVKSKPMDLTKMQQTNNDVNMITGNGGTVNNFNQSILSQMNTTQISQAQTMNADLRKKLRVDRVRKMTIGHKEASATYTSVEDPSQPDWAKIKSLKEIEIIRETKKDQVLSRVMDDYCSTSDQMSVISGQLEFFTCKVHNPYTMNEVYTVHINDPDERILQQPEMTLVTDQAELRHWASLQKFSRPNNYDAIQRTGDIYLQPNDEVELLFKYITTRDVTSDPNLAASADIIKPRKVQIIILQTNKQPYNTIELNVVPSSSIVDHTFRFYEPENSHVTLVIPPFLQLNHSGLFGVISKPNVIVELDKQSSSFKIQTKTESAPELKEMTLFVYGDQYREQVLATCAIEVFSMKTIYTKIKAGLQSTQSLSLPSEFGRQVMIHSNNPKLVYLPKRSLNQVFKIIPQTTNHISVCAKAFVQTVSRVRINCTDVNSGQLVYQWLMMIDADQPTVTQVHQINIQMNYYSSQQMKFQNKLNQQACYEFATSRPDLVRPFEERITFEKKEGKMIRLDFSPQTKFGTIEIYLYANDLEYNQVECYLLKVTYMP
eukprot:403376962